MLVRVLIVAATVAAAVGAFWFIDRARHPVWIDEVQPNVAFPGQDLTLTGKGFPADGAGTTVLFNQRAARPTSAAPGALLVTVPAGARSGMVQVRVGDALSNARYLSIAQPANPPGEGGMGGMEAMPEGHPPLDGVAMGGMGPAARQAAPPGEDGQAGHAESGQAHEFYAPEQQKPAPAFTLDDEQGKPVSLSAFAGKVIVLNFWATWCPPCLEEIPSLERLTGIAAARADDLAVLAVSVDDDPAAIRAKLPDVKLHILLDPGAVTAHAYGTQKFPETYIIGRDGKILSKFIGARNWDSPIFANYLGMVVKGEDPMGGAGR